MEEANFKCDKCGKVFETKDALEMHTIAKHSESTPTEKKKVSGKKVRNWIVFIIVIALIGLGVYAMMTKQTQLDNLPVTEINIGSHNNLALHIHSQLEIKIDNQSVPIPSGIGLAPGIMRPLHTHDSTGLIHIEGPSPRDFTLGEFFQVWNKTFNSTCIFEHCSSPGVGQMEMFVNGEKSTAYDSLILRDEQEIVIEYRSF